MATNGSDLTAKPGGGDASGGTRRYHKSKRARQQAQTRERIIEAAMELHRTAGPANTTVTQVAERAGVSRMTVYNHFPADLDLIEACSDHWQQKNALPDPEPWAQIRDPDIRIGVALAELYGWYRNTEDMMGKILRDAPIVPALGELMRGRWWTLIERMVDTLSSERDPSAIARERVRASIRVALDFGTWKTLTTSGLDDGEAAEVAAGFVIVTDSNFKAP